MARARHAVAAAGYQRVRVVHGDGAVGVPDAAPYDRIIVQGHALQAGLVEPIYSWGSMGCCTSDTFADLTRRPAPSDAGQEMVELGACAYGPGWGSKSTLRAAARSRR